jgi:hypothetical protein
LGHHDAGSADPFTLAQSVVPLPGALVLGPVTLSGTTPAISSGDVSIAASDPTLPEPLDIGTKLPADRVDTGTGRFAVERCRAWRAGGGDAGGDHGGCAGDARRWWDRFAAGALGGGVGAVDRAWLAATVGNHSAA